MKLKFSAAMIAAALGFGLASAANAATVEIAGEVYDEEALADSVLVGSGSMEIFDGVGTGVTTLDEAIGGSAGDGIRCVGTGGCMFWVGFDGGVTNNDGADIAIYGLGVTDTEFFDVGVGSIRMEDLLVTGTGEYVNNWELGVLYIDLSDFGIDIGETINSIKIYVDRGINSQEFVDVVALDDVITNPIPAAAWLFGSALMAGGFASRKRKQAA